MSDNVIPFEKPNKSAAVPAAKAQIEHKAALDRAKAKATVGAAVGKAGVGLLSTVRYVVFLLLLWMRPPVRFISNLITIPMMFTIPMLYFGMTGSPQKTMMLTWAISAGFGAFVLSWFYDVLLTRLSPEPVFFN